MRMIQGAAPGASIAEHYHAIRDNAHLQGATCPSEAVPIAELHQFSPPAFRPCNRVYAPPRTYPAPSESVLTRRAQLDFHKSIIASLGGSRTIVPNGPSCKPVSMTDIIPHPSNG